MRKASPYPKQLSRRLPKAIRNATAADQQRITAHKGTPPSQF